MKDILDARVAFVSLFFSAFGSALTRLFVIKDADIGWNVTGFAGLLSLIISLLISVFFIKKNKRRIILRRYVLILLFAGSVFYYFNRMYVLVCDEQVRVKAIGGINDSPYTIHIIPGKKLIDTGDEELNRINSGPLKCTLCDSLATHDPSKIWTADSIKAAKFQLTFGYILLVIFLVALVTHLTEELLQYGKKAVRKNIK